MIFWKALLVYQWNYSIYITSVCILVMASYIDDAASALSLLRDLRYCYFNHVLCDALNMVKCFRLYTREAHKENCCSLFGEFDSDWERDFYPHVCLSWFSVFLYMFWVQVEYLGGVAAATETGEEIKGGIRSWRQGQKTQSSFYRL